MSSDTNKRGSSRISRLRQLSLGKTTSDSPSDDEKWKTDAMKGIVFSDSPRPVSTPSKPKTLTEKLSEVDEDWRLKTEKKPETKPTPIPKEKSPSKTRVTFVDPVVPTAPKSDPSPATTPGTPINLSQIQQEFELNYNRARQLENTSNFLGQMIFSVLALYGGNIIVTSNPRLASSYAERLKDLRKRVKALELVLARTQFSGGVANNTSIARMATDGNPTGKGNSYGECCNYMVSFYLGSSQCQDFWFRNIVGLKTQKQTLLEYLIDPLVFEGMQDEKPRGILFYGPPGTGKTVLVKAAVNELMNAGEANPLYKGVKFLFYSPTPDVFKNEYFGGSEKAIKAAFECASKSAQKIVDDSQGKLKAISILFLDEFDSIAPSRNGDDKMAATTVNALLQAMQGIQSAENVIVIAASNFPWKLDPAVLERFNRKLYVPLPGATEIEQLINMRINKMVRKSLTKYSLPEDPVQDSPKGIDNCEASPSEIVSKVCKPPVKTEADNYNWYDQEFQTYFPNLSLDDIRSLSRYMAGNLSTNLLYGENVEPAPYVRLSNRQIDEIVKEVRNRALQEAKRKKVFLKKPNPVYPNKELIFSIDSIPERDWENINRDTELYLSEPLRGSQDVRIRIGKEDIYLSNMQLYPVMDPASQGAVAGYYGAQYTPWYRDLQLGPAIVEIASVLVLGTIQNLQRIEMPKDEKTLEDLLLILANYYRAALRSDDVDFTNFGSKGSDTQFAEVLNALSPYLQKAPAMEKGILIGIMKSCLETALRSDNFVEAALKNARINQTFKNRKFVLLRRARFQNMLNAVHHVLYQFRVTIKTDYRSENALKIWGLIAGRLGKSISEIQNMTKKEILDIDKSAVTDVVSLLDKLGSDTERHENVYVYWQFKYDPDKDPKMIPFDSDSQNSLFKKLTDIAQFLNRVEKQDLSQILDQNFARFYEWRRNMLTVRAPTKETRSMFSPMDPSDKIPDDGSYQSSAIILFPTGDGRYSNTRLADPVPVTLSNLVDISGDLVVPPFLATLNGAQSITNIGAEDVYFRITGSLFSDSYYASWNSSSGYIIDLKAPAITDIHFGTVLHSTPGSPSFKYTGSNITGFREGWEPLRQSDNLASSSKFFLNWNLRYDSFVQVMKGFSTSLSPTDEKFFTMYQKDASSVDQILALSRGQKPVSS